VVALAWLDMVKSGVRFVGRCWQSVGTAMPLYESDSIILKTYPLAEADRIIVFFSRDYGKLRGVANGVKRTTSRFGASLEPLARSKVTFFQKENLELVRIRSSELISSPMKLFEDYDRAILAAHVADLVDRFLPDHEVHDAVFRLFSLARTKLVGGCPLDVVKCYFEVWMLRLAGVLPDMFTCSLCRRKLQRDESRRLLPGLTTLACDGCGAGKGTEVPTGTIAAFGWIMTTALDLDTSCCPETDSLNHIQQLNKVWMDRYFER
jgi:DNA repair protein RecO (recombination protein O)